MPGVQGKYTIDVTNRFGLVVDDDDQVSPARIICSSFSTFFLLL